jgi:glycosyltransferase involved in cell wall biosynthesis
VRVTYVLPNPELGGGSKVVFQHAELLRGRGFEVTVLGAGPCPGWAPFAGRYLDHGGPLPALPPQDLVIATFWTTVELAKALELGPVAHFCQGYEGSHRHYRDDYAEIERAYRHPGPALAVTPHLRELLRDRFDRPAKVVPPPLDPLFRPAWRRCPRRRPWVVVPGVFGPEVKDVPTALRSVRRLRDRGIEARILRISTHPLEREERELLAPDRYLRGIPPAEVARELRRCDLLLFPSRPEEGFGLPLLEAMASGVPAVASRIPSTELMTAGAIPLVPPGDVEAFAAEAERLLTDPRAWRHARRLGRRQSSRFAPEAVADALAEAVRWAAGWSP